MAKTASAKKEHKEYIFPNGNRISLTHKKITAFDRFDNPFLVEKIENVKGGWNAAIHNFKFTRSFTSPKDIDFVVETYPYENGIKQVGIYNQNANRQPDIPTFPIYQYAVQAVMKDGNFVIGTSPKVVQNNLNIETAKEMAYTNMYKQFSSIYSSTYGEQEGIDAMKSRRIFGKSGQVDLKKSNVLYIREGWIFYDTSKFDKDYIKKKSALVQTRKNSQRKRH